MTTGISRDCAPRRFGKLDSFHRHFLWLTAVAIFILSSFESPVWSFSPDEDLTARAAVLRDACTGKILYQKESDLRLPPQSVLPCGGMVEQCSVRIRGIIHTVCQKTATRVPA